VSGCGSRWCTCRRHALWVCQPFEEGEGVGLHPQPNTINHTTYRCTCTRHLWLRRRRSGEHSACVSRLGVYKCTSID
jgi:hypothetical protein